MRAGAAPASAVRPNAGSCWYGMSRPVLLSITNAMSPAAKNGRLLPLQQALPADDCLITSRQTVEHSDASDVLRGRLLKQVVEDLRGEVVRCVVVAADSRTQLLHRAQL